MPIARTLFGNSQSPNSGIPNPRLPNMAPRLPKMAPRLPNPRHTYPRHTHHPDAHQCSFLGLQVIKHSETSTCEKSCVCHVSAWCVFSDLHNAEKCMFYIYICKHTCAWFWTCSQFVCHTHYIHIYIYTIIHIRIMYTQETHIFTLNITCCLAHEYIRYAYAHDAHCTPIAIYYQCICPRHSLHPVVTKRSFLYVGKYWMKIWMSI